MRKITIVSCLFLMFFIAACSAEKKVELSKVEMIMAELGNNIGFHYLRSDDPPEIIEAQILATLESMKKIKDLFSNESDLIRNVRIDEINKMIKIDKIHEQPQNIRNEIANIFIEKFNYEKIGDGGDLVNLSFEVEKVLSK